MEMDGKVMLWSNFMTAVSYYIITTQLLLFAQNPKVLKIFAISDDRQDSKANAVFRLMLSVLILFALFIFLCGSTHFIQVFRHFYPENVSLKSAQLAVMIACAIISTLTAIVGFRLFPAIAKTFPNFVFGEDGTIQHSDSYLLEVVKLIKESILILSDNLIVIKGNDMSNILFGSPIVGTSICDYIKPSDTPAFHEAVIRVMGSYTFTPATVEVRIRRVIQPSRVKPIYRRSRPAAGHPSQVYSAPSPAELVSPLDHTTDDEFLWIEITMCKGKYNTADGGLGFDVKLVCRDIDDRKQHDLYQAIIDSTEERDRVNSAKLRYISCIAHDLKTPLQSFSFTLDLLHQTDLLQEQREIVQQANVAVDLMKLTISQTMDISKALTGAKLMPRRTTVFLSSVMNRVKIIINGYSKQVPVSFEIAPDVCDAIITDEEWLWQMLLNLLTNACKYTDRGGIHVRISISIANDLPEASHATTVVTTGTTLVSALPRLFISDVQSTMLKCEVIDTGIGISPDKIMCLFDAFTQLQEGQVTGTGLGLFGVRTRAEGLNGTCGAHHNTHSVTGSGTVLWFAVPYTPDEENSSKIHSARTNEKQNVEDREILDLFKIHEPITSAPATHLESEHSTSMSTIDGAYSTSVTPVNEYSSVPTRRSGNYQDTTASEDFALETADIIRRLQLSAIVVENTASVRKLMVRLLLKMGFSTVTGYENGAKGLDAMVAGAVDIVFSDIQMPIMTGPEMVARFRKLEADRMQTFKNQGHAIQPVPVIGVPNPLPQRPRQLIVAVTANGTESGNCGEHGFDEMCFKPLTKTDIYRVVSRFFQ